MDWQSLASYGGAVFAAAIAVAAGFFWKRSNALLCFVLGMLFLAAESAVVGLVLNSVHPGEIIFWEKWILVLGSVYPGVWLIFSALFSRGDQRSPVATHWWKMLIAAALPGVLTLLLLFTSWLSKDSARSVAMWVHVWILVAAVLILLNLERTIRASVGVIRWRIKFVVLAVAIFFVTRCYTSSQTLLFSSMSVTLQVINSASLVLCCLLLGVGLLRMGVKKGVTVYPSHSLLQGSITLLLGGVYLVFVGALAKVIGNLGGAQSIQAKALFMLVALLLLGVALLSDKLRLRLRNFVSNHFSRPIYDYRAVWQRFTGATGQCSTPEDLCRAVAELVSEFFQALSVHVWIFDENKASARRIATTASSPADKSQSLLTHSEVANIASGLMELRGPFDLTQAREGWARPLARVDFEVFDAGGNRVCCPIRSGSDLLGWITLGDRVSGVPFGMQDLELLKVISEQAGASLLRLQISEKLLQARQLEAFQAMSAFFVHDLKNTASVLTLTLQNFPLHYQDPEFREDALRGMAKTVDHVNELIGRLGALRHELSIRAVECNLNDVVNAVIQKQPEPRAISKSLMDLPRIQMDPEAIDKVLSNLLLNAREATRDGAPIEVSTSRRNGWVVVDIRDSGCGMTPEFLRQSLFRPFQSTKKRGLGIGMFHCKMLVEAHKGRIEVESEPGKGTCFHILLPVTLHNE